MKREDQNEVQCHFCLKFFPENSTHYCSGVDGDVELPKKESEKK